MTAHALVPQCFELLRRQNIQKFSRALPLDPTGTGLQHPPPPYSPAAQWFFCSLRLSRNWHLPKIAGYGTDIFLLLQVKFAPSEGLGIMWAIARIRAVTRANQEKRLRQATKSPPKGKPALADISRVKF